MLPPVLQYLLVGVTVVTFLAASFQYIRGGRSKYTIDVLEKNSDALAERVQILEADIERRKTGDLVRDATETALEERIAALERENAVLKTVDNASDKITSLAGAISSHHNKAMSGIEKLTALLQDNHNGLTQLHEDLVQIGHLDGPGPDGA